MQCCTFAPLYSIAALLLVCWLLVAGCGDSSSSLVNTNVLAADLILTQAPTPVVLKLYDNSVKMAPANQSSTSLKLIKQENQAVDTATLANDLRTIQWHEAAAYVGQSMLVCGPVVGTRYASTEMGSPTFINLGADYPHAQRFTIVIWGSNQANFTAPPDQYYLDKTLCVGGVILSFKGITEIEVSKPAQIEVKR